MRKKKTVSGTKQSISEIEEVVDRFNTDKQNFICTEALKIFCQTKDDDTALRALELLTEAAQPF